jgi:hypothetical protein
MSPAYVDNSWKSLLGPIFKRTHTGTAKTVINRLYNRSVSNPHWLYADPDPAF